jgi:hypothetical protein
VIGLRKLVSPSPTVSPARYVFIAPPLLLTQHFFVAVCFWFNGKSVPLNWEFWIFPIRRLANMADISSALAASGFLFCLAVSWALALLSFRRANWAGHGHAISLFAMIPSLQMLAVAAMLVLPKAKPVEIEIAEETVSQVPPVLLGVLSGVSIIVGATVISALTFGAYGWGLFVMTPFLVGVTTAYFANRWYEISSVQTINAVIMAGFLGSLALLMLALEGLACILLIAPLAAVLAILGGLIGRAMARNRDSKTQPLMSIALLPLIFAVESAIPPSMTMETQQSIEISADRNSVWKALTSDAPVDKPAGLVGFAGLAYPIESHLVGSGRGAERLGVFSTGLSRERVTRWEPGVSLGFRVEKQPPAMEEMSPYRKVHAPHLEGYFDTTQTSFTLRTLPNGSTLLTARATHILRIDPVLYWEPIARWAIKQNVNRVLADIKAKATFHGTKTVSTATLFVPG